MTLSVGSVQQTVNVEAKSVALQVSTAELGVAIVKTEVNDLPLNGRNFTQLLNLTPGVSTVNVSQNSSGAGGVWSTPIGNFTIRRLTVKATAATCSCWTGSTTRDRLEALTRSRVSGGEKGVHFGG